MAEQETVTLAPVQQEETPKSSPWFQAEPLEVEQVQEVSEEPNEESQETSETTQEPIDENNETETDFDQEKKTGFEKRIERFNKRLAEKDAELEQLRQAVAKQQPQYVNEPTLEEFNGDVEKFKSAYKDFVKQEARREVENAVKAQELIQTYNTRKEEFAKVATDFDEVTREFAEDTRGLDNNFAQLINTYLAESDLGPQVYYHLATHRDEAEAILSKPPYKALADLGKIEAKLSAKKEEPKQVVKKVSTAPAPVSKSTGSAPVTVRLDDPNISQSDYRSARMAQRKRKF